MRDEDFIERGFTQFEPGPLDSDWVVTKFQQRYDDDIGKKYFITVSKYKAWEHPHTHVVIPPAYEYDTQFTLDGKPINVTFFSGWELDEVEEKIEEMWKTGGYDYYEIFS